MTNQIVIVLKKAVGLPTGKGGNCCATAQDEQSAVSQACCATVEACCSTNTSQVGQSSCCN